MLIVLFPPKRSAARNVNVTVDAFPVPGMMSTGLKLSRLPTVNVTVPVGAIVPAPLTIPCNLTTVPAGISVRLDGLATRSVEVLFSSVDGTTRTVCVPVCGL